MIERYADPHIVHQWSTEAMIERWTGIETRTALAQGNAGIIPYEAAMAIQTLTPPSVGEVAHYEEKLGHDVAAFLAACRDRIPHGGANWLHFGLTSSDLVDTGLAVAINHIGGHIEAQSSQLAGHLAGWVHAAGETLRIGRTHGQYAEPMHLNHTFMRLLEQVSFAEEDHRTAAGNVQGKLSGPVGNYAQTSAAVEEAVMQSMGVPYGGVATQIVGRWRHAAWAWSLVQFANVCESIATEIRLSAQVDVQEIFEHFEPGQKGSSSMPHKRNPIRSERLCGLARVARGYLAPISETAACLWSERDISNSSVERVALADLSILVHWMLTETCDLVKGLVVNNDRMRANLDIALMPFGGQSSASLLSEAIRAGKDRDEAYRAIQRGETP